MSVGYKLVSAKYPSPFYAYVCESEECTADVELFETEASLTNWFE